ncbi:MAG: hypothetical protein ACR2IH_02805 [Pyrinomonadaceae bacterium]
MNSNQQSVGILANATFQLFDDDDFNDNDGTLLDGDGGNENVPMPDTSLLTQDSDDPATNVFAPAYIHPRYDIGDNNDNVAFSGNYATARPADIQNQYDFDQRATQASSSFWTVYILGAYQFTTPLDGDPYTEDTFYGYVDNVFPLAEGASIFLETNRSKEYPPDWASRPVGQRYTVAHEVGHLFNGSHAQPGLMKTTADRSSGSFGPLTLARIRDTEHP